MFFCLILTKTEHRVIFEQFSDTSSNLNRQLYADYTIRHLPTNYSFDTEDIRTLIFCTDLISFGSYFETAV